MTAIYERRTFNMRYVVRTPQSIAGGDMRFLHRTAQCNYWYIMRQTGVDEFGATPNFAARGDLVDAGRAAPIRGHVSALAGVALWQAADEWARDRRPDQATAIHAVASLPPEASPLEWRNLVVAFCEDHFAANGMIADWAIHAKRDETGEYAIHPHWHAQITARTWSASRDPGKRQAAWFTRPAQVAEVDRAWSKLTGLYPSGAHSMAN